MDISAGFSFFSLIGVASITIVGNHMIRMIFEIIFVTSLSLYFLLGDGIMKKANLKVGFVSFLWDFIPPLVFVISYQLNGNIAAILQYSGGLLLFTKYFWLWWTLPQIGILLTKKTL